MRGVNNFSIPLPTDTGGGDQRTPRANDQSNKHRFASLWKFLNSMRARSEPKPKIQDGFLEQTSRRGAKYSASGALRALVEMRRDGSPINCHGLTLDQRSRLLNNLRKHAELPSAIDDAIFGIANLEDKPEGAAEFIECLKGLKSSLTQTYQDVGGNVKDTVSLRISKRDMLSDALIQALTVGRGGDSAENKILERLAMPLNKPSPMEMPRFVEVHQHTEVPHFVEVHQHTEVPHFVEVHQHTEVPRQPARVYDAEAITRLKTQVKRYGTIAQEDVEGLMREFMQRANIDQEFFKTYVDSFMSASARSRYAVLSSLFNAFKGAGSVREEGVELAIAVLNNPWPLLTVDRLRSIIDVVDAQLAIHEIAERHEGAVDLRAAVLQELRNELTPEEAMTFVRGMQAFINVEGNSKVVFDAIKDFANRKIELTPPGTSQ